MITLILLLVIALSVSTERIANDCAHTLGCTVIALRKLKDDSVENVKGLIICGWSLIFILLNLSCFKILKSGSGSKNAQC